MYRQTNYRCTHCELDRGQKHLSQAQQDALRNGQIEEDVETCLDCAEAFYWVHMTEERRINPDGLYHCSNIVDPGFLLHHRSRGPRLTSH